MILRLLRQHKGCVSDPEKGCASDPVTVSIGRKVFVNLDQLSQVQSAKELKHSGRIGRLGKGCSPNTMKCWNWKSHQAIKQRYQCVAFSLAMIARGYVTYNIHRHKRVIDWYRVYESSLLRNHRLGCLKKLNPKTKSSLVVIEERKELRLHCALTQ